MRWWLLLGLCACGGARGEDAAPAAAQRPVCGWESVEAEGEGPPKVAPPARLSLHARDDGRAVPGTQVLVLEVDDQVPFAAVREALAPAEETLVRIKVLIDGRWLLPMTARGRVPVVPPPKSQTVESVVGKRILRRPRGAPAVRFADLRLEGASLLLYVENDNPRGRRLRVAELAAALRRIEPPATAFALTASGDTAWRDVMAAFVAAACYDREPEDEPHEVILD